MAITIEEVLTAQGSDTTITSNTGAGTAVNDYLLVFYFSDFYNSANIQDPTPGTWTALTVATLGVDDLHTKAFGRFVTSAGSNGVSVSSISDEDVAMVVLRLRGVDTSQPLDVAADPRVGSTASTSHVADAVTTTTANTVVFFSYMTGNGEYTAIPSGTTQRANIEGSPFYEALVVSQAFASAGSTGTKTATFDASRAWVSITVAIRNGAGTAQDLNVGFHTQTNSIFSPSIANQSAENLAVGLHNPTTTLFAPGVANQDANELAVGFHGSTSTLFAPTIEIGDLNLAVGLLSSSATLFAPSIANQSAQELTIGFISSTASLFGVTIENASDISLEVGLATFSSTFYSPTVFNEGDELFEPTLAGNGSLADQIMAGLIDQGFITGSLSDREYNRLLSKLTLTVEDGYTLQDLYDLADEPNRLAGLLETV